MEHQPIGYLSAPAAAVYLSMSHATLAKLRVVGGGPAFCKLGRKVVYAIADLDTWATRKRVHSTSA